MRPTKATVTSSTSSEERGKHKYARANQTDTDQPIVASLVDVDATAISAMTDNDI